MSEPLIHTLPSGLEVQVKDIFDWFVFCEIFADQVYAPALDLALETRSFWSDDFPLRIVDVGANVGYFTLYAADKLINHKIPYFDITCVEGSLKNVEELRLRLRQQPTNKFVNKVDTLYGIVGKRAGYVDFQTNSNHALNYVRGIQPRGHEVPCNGLYYDLEPVLSKDRIDLLKVDIEGSEEAFLKEYPDLIKRTSIIVVELHEVACDVANCRRILTDYERIQYSSHQKGDVCLDIWV